VLLLVGNQHGEISSGIWVTFGRTLRDSWGEYLRRKHAFSTKWMYESNLEHPPTQELQWALNEAGVKEEEFETRLDTWRYVMNQVALPLPPIVRVLPKIFSTWNGRKVGSDTITYLVDSVKWTNPYRQPQSVVVARFVQYLQVLAFRLIQHSTRNHEDVTRYVTLRRYRNAATQRISFPKFVEKSAYTMQRMWHSVVTLPSGVTPASVAQATPRTRRAVSQSQRVVTVAWGSAKTSLTPAKTSSKIYKK